MKHKFTTVLLCCLAAQVAVAQDIRTDRIDAYFDTLQQNDKFMGSVSVSRNGIPIYSRSVGFADIEAQQKASPQTRYKIGSISKSFTAVMIFRAIEQGHLSLATPLARFFPDIEHADSITIDNMLSHRSGIHNFTAGGFESWATEPQSPQRMVDVIREGGSDFAPGSSFGYSNSNYVLLSYILENVYKMPFSKILKRDITGPLKMADTYFDTSAKRRDGACPSYKYLDKWRIESDTDPSVTMGAGGIVSTPRDLNIFFEGMFGGKLVSDSTLKQMTTIRDRYGRGLIMIPFYDKVGYGHTGGIDGFNSVSSYFPGDKTSYSLTSNGSNYVINNISVALLSAIYDKPFDIPSFRVINLTSDDLDKYLGVYSCSSLPIKISITKRGNVLVGQGTAQPSFDMVASSTDIFRFDTGGVVMEFNPEQSTMVLKQGGASFLMKRE